LFDLIFSLEENRLRTCGSFFWEEQVFSCEGKLKEGRTEKAKPKHEKNQTGMINFWLSLFVIYGDVIRSPYLI
jgi:hypothetical protein